MKEMDSMIRVASVRLLGERRVEITMTSGETRELDLAPLLVGPVFVTIREDDAVFAQVRVDPEFGTLVWPSGADICPDVLIHDRRPV